MKFLPPPPPAALIAANGVGLQNPGRKLKIVSGFLAHTTSVGWAILNDSGHGPIGVDLGTALTIQSQTAPNGQTINTVRVTFTAATGLTGVKVVNCIVGNYEDVENGITSQPNIGGTNVTFHMYQRRTWRGHISYDGSSWTRTGDLLSLSTGDFATDGVYPGYRQKSLVTNSYGFAISTTPGVKWIRRTAYPWVRNVDNFRPVNTTTGAYITTPTSGLGAEIVRVADDYVDANDTANFPNVYLPFTVILSYD